MSTLWCRAPTALRIRVSMSAIGSFILSSRGGPRGGPSRLPARLRHPGHQAEERQVPEADTAHLEPAHVRAGPATAPAAVAVPNGELGLLAVRRLPGLGRHRSSLPSQSRRNGTPRSVSRLRASSSVFAVVTTVMFIPRALSTLA